MISPEDIVARRKVAAGELISTRMHSTRNARLWATTSAAPRCTAIHPDSEIRCEFEVHEGYDHEFLAPVKWSACFACGGWPQFDLEHNCEVILHMVDCPRLVETE